MNDEPYIPRKPLSTDETTAFKAHIDLANSERTAIWARNSTMLLSNSVLVSAGGISNSTLRSVAIGLIGLVICIIWHQMTIAGWAYVHRHNTYAKVIWGGPNSPVGMRNSEAKTDTILSRLKILILLFMILHTLMIIFSVINHVYNI